MRQARPQPRKEPLLLERSTYAASRIVIHFQQGHYRNFKAYSRQYVAVQLRDEFPTLVSYHRFVEVLPTIVVPLCAYLPD